MKKLSINNLSLNNLSLNKSSIKKQTLPFAILSLTAASVIFSPNAAASELSANVGFTSNYLWRGIEQTGGDAAVSGGIDFSNDSGFYVGTWASNASWAPGMTYELDFYGAFAGKLSESVEYDVGFIYYAYPDETSGDADFSEIYGSVSFDTGLSLGLAVLVDGEGADALPRPRERRASTLITPDAVAALEGHQDGLPHAGQRFGIAPPTANGASRLA